VLFSMLLCPFGDHTIVKRYIQLFPLIKYNVASGIKLVQEFVILSLAFNLSSTYVGM
jgi:hypothetical protein